ncbi:xanthine dehydrogenase family protein molybdopterin-binding subunit [Streptomyces glomeratus]|uniref:Xanthine dehydrogenase family protein molybdopterin-binding subunit n=1 Tax=Streptomyces glomeratus TaxID=284452 RepID=A0ABP6LW17_9ACTN|nr:xanthine dehydrogenase family protein molybdopterin-binding subunit [Streptomyces glomeratus]MCF1506193.1 xanthine dehydrogenase family protein molybdopterin-binding subunit [Streptomyces glomeratus]
MSVISHAVGTPLDRLDGPDKVKGAAVYAAEHPVDRPAYLYPLQATIAVGRVIALDTAAAGAEPDVLAVLTHRNAPRLASAHDAELAVLQSDEVAYRGQIIGGVIAETPETARHAAHLVRVTYAERAHDVALRPDRDDLYKPLNAAFFCRGGGELMDGSPADSAVGDVDAALAAAEVRLDATYTTPINHHNPMEPHTAVALWSDDELTVYCSTQGVTLSRDLLATVFGLDPRRVRVVCPHVGGAFGSKVYCHSYAVLAAMAAQIVHRPVKFALTRRQMFSLVGYRPATVQRIRLGADPGGRLTAIAHDVVVQTAKAKGYAEQVAVCTRCMYAAPHRRTTHRLAPLDLPVPTIMRAPGQAQGMFALESAMDEMAIACGLDPVEFRIRNEPGVDPETGRPFSSRHLVDCLRDGARRFGWDRRGPVSRARREGAWLVGTGVSASTHPSPRFAGNTTTIRAGPDGRHTVLIAAADLGTGTWTALTQIAADALGVTVDEVELRIGDTALPPASPAGGSAGIDSWGTSVVETAGRLRALIDSHHGGVVPPQGLEVTSDMPDNPDAAHYAMHSFGAQFAEVRVHADTGEVRVPRLLGVFDAGRVINPKTARSQLLGGMTMGLSMALHEQGVVDPRFGHVVNGDLAEYHIASHADVGSVEAYWVEAEDPHTNPMGSKGIGEVGIVGTAAAIANAVHHATGIRVRDLPITLDKLLRQPVVEE